MISGGSLVTKHHLVGRFGLFVSISVFVGACAVGDIGDSFGSPRGDTEDGSDEVVDTPPVLVPSNPSDPSAPSDPGEPAALQCPGANADVSASNGWRSSEASLPAYDALYFEFKARPTAANLNGLIGVGAEPINEFAETALSVRFAKDGLVDVRDGAVYNSDVSYAYEPGVWYTVAVSANIETETYDVEIGRCGELRETLIKGAAFRQEANMGDQLSNWAVWSSQSAALELATPTWMASGGCAPASCESLGQECGQPSDGCGGSLSCGDCESGDVCASGLCVAAPPPPAAPPPVTTPPPPVTTPPPPGCIPATCLSLGAECGQRSDGCGGTLSCGGCASGESCSSNICVAAPVTPPPACVPATCQSLGAECGQRSNGCGGTLNCGGCASGESCSSNICVAAPVTPPPPPPPGDPDRPWAHNTGPSNPGALRPSGSLSITTDGAVYENLDISGDVWIDANNVTIRNFRINGGSSSFYGINIASGKRGIVLEDGEILRTGNGIRGLGYTARRLHIHDNNDDGLRPEGVPGSGPTLVEYCFIEKMGLSAGAHADALQVSGVSDGSYNVTLQYNNFYMPAPGSPGHPGDASKASAVIFLAKPVSNYLIQNNWMDGGGYTVYCGGNTGDVLWRNNIFGTNYDYAAVTGTCQNWSGNVWEDTGAPVPPN